MVSDEALKKLQEQIAAWPMTQRFVVQQLIEDYRKNREDLRAYKDTGLTPESVEALKLSMMGKAIAEIKEFNGLPVDRLRELAEADKDGRLVVLSCKVGDTVWFNTYKDNGKTCIGIRPHKVISTGAYITAEGEILPVELPVSRFGENWFRTREEAEAALEEMKE